MFALAKKKEEKRLKHWSMRCNVDDTTIKMFLYRAIFVELIDPDQVVLCVCFDVILEFVFQINGTGIVLRVAGSFGLFVDFVNISGYW